MCVEKIIAADMLKCYYERKKSLYNRDGIASTVLARAD